MPVNLGPISLSRDLVLALCVRAESTPALLVPSLRQRVSHVPMPRHRQPAAQPSQIVLATKATLDLQAALALCALLEAIKKSQAVHLARDALKILNLRRTVSSKLIANVKRDM